MVRARHWKTAARGQCIFSERRHKKVRTSSGRVALMVGQARLTKRLPLKTQQGNFCGQIGDWRNSPAKCCDSIKYLSSPRAEVVENRPCVRVHPPAQGGRTGVGD